MTALAIEIDGATFRAVLHDDAPASVRLLLDALPLVAPLRHSRWSGETVYLTDPSLVAPSLQPASIVAPLERPASIMCPGTLHWGPARGNLGLPYGQAQSRAVGGTNTYGVHIGTVDAHAAYFEILRSIRIRGAIRAVVRTA